MGYRSEACLVMCKSVYHRLMKESSPIVRTIIDSSDQMFHLSEYVKVVWYGVKCDFTSLRAYLETCSDNDYRLEEKGLTNAGNAIYLNAFSMGKFCDYAWAI